MNFDVFSVDFFFILLWWVVIFFIGAAAFPLARLFFSSWWDEGYSLSKVIGIAGTMLISWYLGSFKILPFTQITIIGSVILLLIIGVFLHQGGIRGFHLWRQSQSDNKKQSRIRNIHLNRFMLLEIFFFCCLFFWSFIKAHEPDIRSLEKFMDYGFAQSILNAPYFPPPDMWYAGGTINYYYFGHAVMVMLSKLSGINLAYGYNLMLATLFALCFTMSFSISVQLTVLGYQLSQRKPRRLFLILAGLLGAFLVSLSGNMQTIYAFTKGYHHEDTPPPFWTILHSPSELFAKLPESMNSYWYANATRFIPFTIHEFPSYSFVVSDNHGHVLGIPFALLAIASILTMFVMKDKTLLVAFVLYGGLVGVLFMTNALDGPIYLGIMGILILVYRWSAREPWSWEWIQDIGSKILSVAFGFIAISLPFLLNFKSFATGLAVNCPPKVFENTKIGPLLFETVEQCQRSPLWMIWLLWGFFFFCGIALIIKTIRISREKGQIHLHVDSVNRLLIVLFLYSVGLIFFAEFFYFKDIYPADFRSNTMFKLGYQAFIICSLLSAYIIVQMLERSKQQKTSMLRLWGKRTFFILLMPQLFLVSIYPFFSVRSYFGGLQVYRGLDGLQWFARDYPDDYAAMRWLRGQMSGVGYRTSDTFLRGLAKQDVHVRDTFFTRHLNSIPVIVEADGESYTDYNTMSAFAGAPTIIGWAVHEWLWRGSYDVVAPRRDEVRLVYEGDAYQRRRILQKYAVRYIVIGTLERQKFQNLREDDIMSESREVFRSGNTVIYQTL